MRISGGEEAEAEQELNSVSGEHLRPDGHQTLPSVRTNQAALNEEERWSRRGRQRRLELKQRLKRSGWTRRTKQSSEKLQFWFKIKEKRKQQISAGFRPRNQPATF